MEWQVEIMPEVISGIKSFQFTEPTEKKVLESIEGFLRKYADDLAKDRWPACPDDFFVYRHILVDANRFHTLTFLVKDSSGEYGVLRVAWVEHAVGEEFP